jgi:hypothetical protein
MAGMRDYSDEEIDLVRKSFGGRYALRDRCYFEMALQMGLCVSEMLSLTVSQVFQDGKVAGLSGIPAIRCHPQRLRYASPSRPRQAPARITPFLWNTVFAPVVVGWREHQISWVALVIRALHAHWVREEAII